jgi:hypothetical protein
MYVQMKKILMIILKMMIWMDVDVDVDDNETRNDIIALISAAALYISHRDMVDNCDIFLCWSTTLYNA